MQRQLHSIPFRFLFLLQRNLRGTAAPVTGEDRGRNGSEHEAAAGVAAWVLPGDEGREGMKETAGSVWLALREGVGYFEAKENGVRSTCRRLGGLRGLSELAAEGCRLAGRSQPGLHFFH